MSFSFRHAEAAAVENSIDVLEKHRETAVALVKSLSDFLFTKAKKSDDIHHWHQELIRLADGGHLHAGPAETLIMVVGSMGAGKSTAINALLDEPRLLPTSGYDACTSVATEVRYNHSSDPKEAYRAEITFITKDELLNELLVLREDVLSVQNPGGGSAGAAAADDDDSSPAEVAWDKIHAVWPCLTRAELARPAFDVHELLKDRSIRFCLGETHQVFHSTAAGLCRSLERFVANRDNASLAKRAEGVHAEQQLWPLVDKVDIFVKAEVLSTGAVIKDMPGGRDGNSARSARAAVDGDRCDHLCVLVPVKRAISEQIVKKPFNDASTFKNWIKFDGRLGDITYVCTMIDDAIEIDRDAEEFGLLDHLEESRRLEGELDLCEIAFANTNERLDALQDKSQASEGTGVSRVKPTGNKRKRNLISEAFREKRLRRNSLPLSLDGNSCSANLGPKTAEDSAEMPASEIEPVDPEELQTRVQDLEVQCEALQRQLMENNFFLKESCIRARNTLTYSAIRREFVHAAKELLSRQEESRSDVTDQGLDADDRFEPQPPMVHTVSARGYFDSQKRHRRGQFWTAETVELSGIPAWRDHIKQLTVPARRRKCQAFLRAVLRCFNHMAIWCDNGFGISLTSEQEKQELATYKQDLDICVKHLGFHFDAFIRECRGIIDRLFSERMKDVLPRVLESAVEVAGTWPSRKRGDQLLTALSYRSACRRGGIYEGKGRVKKSPWNLNDDLAEPLVEEIIYHWDNAFNILLPAVFRDLKLNSTQRIHELSDEADKRMQNYMTESARQKMRVQVRAQIERIRDAVDEMQRTSIGDGTQGILRKQLEAAMRHEMSHVWKECTRRTGPGCHQRQQAIVDRHLRDGAEIYTRAASRVERILWNKCNIMAHTLHNLEGSVNKDMWHAYTTSIVAKVDGERDTREQLRRLLVEGDGHFQTSESLV